MQKEKEQAALGSIAASAALTLAKAVVGVMSGSLAILSEAAHSLIDLGATVMTYAAVRVSGKPPDEEHHYGHGKVESVSALAETALLFLLSGVVIWESVSRLLDHGEYKVEASVWAFGVIILSIVVDAFRSRALSNAAQKTSSQALHADALHFSSDLWASFAVLIGLVGIRFGLPWADAVAALAVAILVCIAGWRLGRRTIDTLLDVAPPGVAERAETLARQIPGVVSVGQVRAREVGEKVFVDLNVAVSRTMPLDRVNALKDNVVGSIARGIKHAEVTVTTEPVALSTESVLERVMVIARNRALAVHHVTVQEIRGKLAVSLDLEVDGKLSLGDAHDIADGLEAALVAELGGDAEIDVHIEPLQPHRTLGREAPPERQRAVEMALMEIAAEGRVIRDIHNVRVRETGDGEIVNFHCRVDPSLPVQTVHEKVDELERALRRKAPSIMRVIGHAEPMR